MEYFTNSNIDETEIKNDSQSEVSTVSDSSFSSEYFNDQEKFLSDLFKSGISNDTQFHYEKIIEEKENFEYEIISKLDSGYSIKPWKNVENISSRLIDFCESYVLMECLVDKENGIYEERKFMSNLFESFNLSIGKLFLLRIYIRDKEMKIQIHDDPKLTLVKDFPTILLADKYKSSKLFKH